MGIQHAHSNSHTDMNVLIEYVSVITAWQNYTYTQQMHNNTWDHNTSQWGKKRSKNFPICLCPVREKKKNILSQGRPHPQVSGGDIVL